MESAQDKDGAVNLHGAIQPVKLVFGGKVVDFEMVRLDEPGNGPVEAHGDVRAVPGEPYHELADDAGQHKQVLPLLRPGALLAQAQQDGNRHGNGQDQRAQLQQRERRRNVRVEHDDPDAGADQDGGEKGHADVDLHLRRELEVECRDAREQQREVERQLPQEAADPAAAHNKVVEKVEDKEELDDAACHLERHEVRILPGALPGGHELGRGRVAAHEVFAAGAAGYDDVDEDDDRNRTAESFGCVQRVDAFPRLRGKMRWRMEGFGWCGEAAICAK